MSPLHLLPLPSAAPFAQIESSLRALAWLLPGQSIQSEALYTSLNLLGLYSDARTAASDDAAAPAATSAHARYTSWWIRRSRVYTSVARLLSVLAYSQLLLEMGARKYLGEKGRWRIVMAIESLKSVLDGLHFHFKATESWIG